MTRRILNAFENPHLHVWGHPTGRLLLKRESAPMRVEEILDCAARKGIAVEVNGCPERLELAPEFLQGALARGLKLVLSTDAHAVGELPRHLAFAVTTARRGWVQRSDVLNTLGARELVQALHARKA
jgi:DNA polymerase (family 10)